VARILVTGMCSARDRLVAHADRKNIRYRYSPDPVSLKSDVITQFRRAANTGNYFITDGAFHALSGKNFTYVPFWYLDKFIDDPEFCENLRSQIDAVVFVTANILNADFQLEREVGFLQSCNKPTLLMSIGVQRVSDLQSALHPSARAFIEFLKGPDVHVITRGPYSFAFLKDQGVRNLTPACCPSAFHHSDNVSAALTRLSAIEELNFREVMVNGYLGAGQAGIQDLSGALGIAERVGYVFQDEPLLFGALSNIDDEATCYNDAASMLTVTPHCHPEALDDTRTSYYAFFTPEQWRARMSASDLVFGRRFHGNLSALQAGRPAFFIAHDDRVQEMLTAVGFPFIPAAEWDGTDDRFRLMRHVMRSFDLAWTHDMYGKAKERFQAAVRRAIG
jgi:Polysaccharide pyruvyl transferase